MLRQTRHEMDQMIFGAGFGTSILSENGYLTARYYHWIIGLLTITIISLEALPLAPLLTLLWVGGYAIYFFARQLMNEKTKTFFYRPMIQFVRVQLGILAIGFFIYALGANAQQTTLWLLFILVLQVASKHCSTMVLLLSMVEVYGTLLALRISAVGIQGFNTDMLWNIVVPQWLWIVTLTFILHYLVRNIDARDETITGYELVNALSSQLDALNDSTEKWKTVLDTCIEVVRADCGFLWTCEYNTLGITLVSHSVAQFGNTSPFSGGFGAKSLNFNDTNVIADVARCGIACYWKAETNRASYLDGQERLLDCPEIFPGIHSLMLIPLIGYQRSKQRTLAILGVAFHVSSPPHKVALIDYQRLLTNMVHHIRPLFYLERHLEELQVLQEIGRESSRSLELEQVLDNVLTAIVATLGFEFATISLVDEDRGLIQSVRGLNVSDEWIKQAVHPLVSKDIQADIVRTGRTEILEGWNDRFDRKIWEGFGHQEMIRVFSPIIAVDSSTRQEKVIGTVEAGYRKSSRRTVDEQQVTMLKVFINQASIAIEKAQMFDRMERRTKALMSLHKVSQEIGAARELPRVLEEIGRSADKVLGTDIIMLYRYSEDEHRLQPPLTFGQVWGKKSLKLTIKEGSILDKIIRDKTPYYAPDALADPYLTDGHAAEKNEKRIKHRSFTQRQNIRSFAGVPLLANNHIVGIMCVNYRKRHRFAEEEQYIIELFAQQAAMAVKNAEINELIRDLASKEERNRLSRELHDSLTQYLPAIGLMADNIRDLLDKDPQAAHQWLDKLQRAAQAANKEVDFEVFQLRHAQLRGELEPAIMRLSKQVQEHFGLRFKVEIDQLGPIRPSIETIVYAVTKEAMLNSAKHGHASNGCIHIYRQNDCVFLWIHDDGCGFDMSLLVDSRRHGLTHIRERVMTIGGKLIIKSAPNRGTLIGSRIPLGRHQHD